MRGLGLYTPVLTNQWMKDVQGRGITLGKAALFNQGTSKRGLVAEDSLLAALPAAGRIGPSVLKVNLDSMSQNQLSNEIWEPFHNIYS